MNKLEQPKGKHNHKWTDILKVCIFSILMLAPFFAVLSKCIYITQNPNAKDSYYGETIETQTYSYNYNQLSVGQEYTMVISQDMNFSGTLTIRGEYFYYKNTSMQEVSLEGYTAMNFFGSGEFYFTGQGQTSIYKTKSNVIEVKFVYLNYSNANITGLDGVFKQIIHPEFQYLDNMFYYAVDQIRTNNLFKWVDNTIIYDGLNAMNTGFGLTQNHVLTYLLAYWTILTAIYIIIDIILFLFTKLTHLLQ